MKGIDSKEKTWKMKIYCIIEKIMIIHDIDTNTFAVHFCILYSDVFVANKQAISAALRWFTR